MIAMKKIIAVIGGTFDELHAGHMKLIHTAFSLGDHVLIGLSTDEFAIKSKMRAVNPYDVRKRRLIEFIENSPWSKGKTYEIFPISDMYGPTIKMNDLDVIIVSVETFSGAMKINEERIKRGLKPLVIHVINMVETERGEKISSTEIVRKQKDVWGRDI